MNNELIKHIWLPYTQMKNALPPVCATRTQGSRVTLQDGREFIDGIASWWTACHGYNHPHIVGAMKRQLDAMPHFMFGGAVNEPAVRLAARLAALAPGDLTKVFFVDSGSVAVEVALKMAVQYWLNKGIKGRTKFVSFLNGYHGDTMACMSLCDPIEGMHAHFKGWLPEQFVMPLPDGTVPDGDDAFENCLKNHGNEIAAVIIEPLVQGAGGMKFHKPEILKRVADLCAKYNVLFIVDEIFTGFGRTGTMFACEQADIVPDILCVGKALTGGVMSLAAAIARDHIFDAFLSDDAAKALMHGPTYMANALACAAANASLDLFENEPRLEQVRAIEQQLRAGLEPCRRQKGVKDMRVLGALGVVQMDKPVDAAQLKQAFMQRGVWVRPYHDIIYVAPAFTITPDELAQLTEAIGDVLGA